LQTIREHKQRLAGLTLTYLGDGANNMAHSYLLAGASAGMHVRIGAPDGYDPDPAILARRGRSRPAPAQRTHVRDPKAATDGADVLATDTWVSMGQEDEYDAASRRSCPTRSTTPRSRWPRPTRSCCTACPLTGQGDRGQRHRRTASVVWDEAENRLHAQKALLSWLLERR